MKTQQQFAFDKALHGVRKQGKLSIQGENCAYRSADGKASCGIGHLIPDSLYKPEFDDADAFTDTSVICLVAESPAFLQALKAGGVEPAVVGMDFLKGLQEAHDRSTGRPSMLNFESRMMQLAKEYGLEYKEKA